MLLSELTPLQVIRGPSGVFYRVERVGKRLAKLLTTHPTISPGSDDVTRYGRYLVVDQVALTHFIPVSGEGHELARARQ